MIRSLGISMEDLSRSASADGMTRVMPLTKSNLATLKSRPDLVASISPTEGYGVALYPQNKVTGWTTANYGPVWIPAKGETLRLTLDNLPIYERPIRVYEGNRLEVKDGQIYINGQRTDSYTFRMDYYWMMGDNRDNSAAPVSGALCPRTMSSVSLSSSGSRSTPTMAGLMATYVGTAC